MLGPGGSSETEEQDWIPRISGGFGRYERTISPRDRTHTEGERPCNEGGGIIKKRIDAYEDDTVDRRLEDDAVDRK